jgi:hypothetical protein
VFVFCSLFLIKNYTSFNGFALPIGWPWILLFLFLFTTFAIKFSLSWRELKRKKLTLTLN